MEVLANKAKEDVPTPSKQFIDILVKVQDDSSVMTCFENFVSQLKMKRTE